MTIAISGKSGCGNSTVSAMVAERLGLRLINYTFRNLAEERGVSFDELQRQASADQSIDRYLDQRQLEMAASGNCVLGSRLAVWLLDDPDLTVYLVASADVRARRIAEREQRTFADALERTNERDIEDRRRYLELYQIDIDTFDHVDLQVDAERHDQFEVTEQIVQAALRAVSETGQRGQAQL